MHNLIQAINRYAKNNLNIKDISFFFLIVAFNVLMFLVVDIIKVDIIKNKHPFGIEIGIVNQIILVLFISFGSFYLHFLKKFPIPTLLILAGSWSNLLERLFFGSVKDYIPIPNGYANLADFELWTGLILLNICIWIPTKFTSKKNSATLKKSV